MIRLGVATIVVCGLLWPCFLQDASSFFIAPPASRAEVAQEKLSEETLVRIEQAESLAINGPVFWEIPFAPQAPLGDWRDSRYQDGCEEAGAIMAMAWVGDKKEISSEEMARQLKSIADFEQEKYGEHRDVSIDDVGSRIFASYFNYSQTSVLEASGTDQLIDILASGKLILAPTDGRALDNPFFTAPGPERHLLLILGYDYQTEEFITHDPGTKRGAYYRYPKEKLFAALRVYPSGYHLPIIKQEKRILVLWR